MKKPKIPIILFSLILLNGLIGRSFAFEDPDDRYIVKIIKARSISNTPIPAVILDTVRGIVWVCPNIQLEQPSWVKANLGQHTRKYLAGRRYTLKMLERQDGNLRIPAIVLDSKDGITWTCPNISEAKINWYRKDLTSGAMKKVTAEEIGILKIKDNGLPSME